LGFKHTRASDIFNKYVGETEKTITELFKEASNQKNVLLIDEADSLLRDRSLSTHSWEITQVNEFLCRMEEFTGILICSSNLINNFDKAAMRRFVFKIKFLDLTDEGKITLTKNYFNEVCLLPENLDKIKEINDLRPGDFKAVRDRLLIVYRDKVSFDEVLDELRLETSYRVNENLIATL
jgi:SpoVK/Ycf46/Vps4 family AAA+-type ATPase